MGSCVGLFLKVLLCGGLLVDLLGLLDKGLLVGLLVLLDKGVWMPIVHRQRRLLWMNTVIQLVDPLLNMKPIEDRFQFELIIKGVFFRSWLEQVYQPVLYAASIYTEWSSFA